jgi:hypothetical protein
MMVEAKKISMTEVKKILKDYDQNTLISIIMDCYKQSSDVKNYIHVLINPDKTIEELYEKTRHLVLQEFFPQRGFGKLRLAQAKKAITDFKNLSNDEARTIDLMIFYVESGVDFTNTYGDINDTFYNSMASMYANAIKKINGNDELHMRFKDRLEALVSSTSGIGWGFHDELSYLFDEYLSHRDEDAL